jgi:glycogen(starch) synthase
VRVLVLSNLYPPNAMGGYELACRDVVDGWRARGHEVTVLTTEGSVAGVVEPHEVQPHVRRSLRWYWRDHVFLEPGRREQLALERHNHGELARVLQEVQPEVISVWHMGGMPLSLLAALDDRAVVLNVCDDWPTYGPKVDPWTRSWARLPRAAQSIGARVVGLPTALPQLDRHHALFVSAFTRDSMRARSPWSFPHATVVPLGVDARDFPPQLPRDREWRWDLLAVGRVEPRKGFDTAVEALAHLPGETRLRIIGVADPEHLAELQRTIAQVGAEGRVTLSSLPRAELRQAYASADALLFTSRWEEPFGLVPLEGMTQAVPVVATRRGGSAEFLTDEANCLAFPAGDAVALAAAVRRLAADRDLRARLVEGGLSTAAGYTVEVLVDRLEALHVQAAGLG